MTIGRGSSNGIPLQGMGISRRQCRLFMDGGILFVDDLGSTNGTFVNGMRLTPNSWAKSRSTSFSPGENWPEKTSFTRR